MSYPAGAGYYKAEPAYAERLKAAGLVDAASVFELPTIEVWRSITERENCVLDDAGGRFHIKRNKVGHRGVEDEAAKLQLLNSANVPTVPLAGYGKLNDGRGFLITDDLAGYEDSEKVVQADARAFEWLSDPTAALAAKLHSAGLHHRDLYLCHFYVGATPAPPAVIAQPPTCDACVAPTKEIDIRLMDAGRVGKLPKLFRARWLVKDLSQFAYSLQQLDMAPGVFDRWLREYQSRGGPAIDAALRRAIDAKVRWIGRHDAKLRRRQPTRNVAIDR